jgi:sulfur carrier protein ThiS
MIVTVHLHTILQRQTPDGIIDRLEVTLSQGSTLADLLQQIGVDMNPDALLLAVNGRVADLDESLSEGDRINLMPAISGGSGLAADFAP